MLCYCKRCGRLVQRVFTEMDKPCDYCNYQLQLVPHEFLDQTELVINDDLKEQFINEYIKSSPEFDQYRFDHRDQDMFEQRMAYKAAISKQSNTPKCPTCGSTNIQKISGTKRWLSTGLFGLASSDIGKSMVCRNCGFKF